jgi:hypothetical protein
MNLTPYLWTWAALAVAVLGMAAYRYVLVRHEDATLDVLENTALASEQGEVFKKANTIERWGKLLTVLVFVYGAAIAGAYLYHVWLAGEQIQR